MNPSEALSVNPRPIPKASHATASAPEAADWLKHPAALIKRVSLAMQLESEPEWPEGLAPEERSETERPIITNDEGGILLD